MLLVSQLQMLALQEVSETRLRRDKKPIPALESDVCRNLRKRDTISPSKRTDKKAYVRTVDELHMTVTGEPVNVVAAMSFATIFVANTNKGK